MRQLFTIDMKDYDPSWPHFTRPSIRAIIRKDDLIAAVYSSGYDYYKFPGGGVEAGELPVDTLIRQVREETGLLVIPHSIHPYGTVKRLQADTYGKPIIFDQQNDYYLCSVREESDAQHLDAYEAEEGFELHWIKPQELIEANETHPHSAGCDLVMLSREANVTRLLLSEGIL